MIRLRIVRRTSRLNLPPEVERVLNAQGRMLSDWAEADAGSPERAGMWQELHRAGDAVWERYGR